MHRERGIDREWMEQRKMSVQKTKSKQSTTCSRLGSIPTKGVLADASPRTKTSKEWEELLRNTVEQEMKTELGRGKIPRKQAQYSFERHVQVYVEEDEVDSDLTVVRLHQALVTLMPAFLAHRLPFVAVATLKNLHEDVNHNERRHK